VRARGHGKKEVVRGVEEKRRRKEWIDELEQRKLITCPVAFSWLDYLAERENKRERKERGERPCRLAPAERDHSSTRYSILHDSTAPRNPNRIFNRAEKECIIYLLRNIALLSVRNIRRIILLYYILLLRIS